MTGVIFRPGSGGGTGIGSGVGPGGKNGGGVGGENGGENGGGVGGENGGGTGVGPGGENGGGVGGENGGGTGGGVGGEDVTGAPPESVGRHLLYWQRPLAPVGTTSQGVPLIAGPICIEPSSDSRGSTRHKIFWQFSRPSKLEGRDRALRSEASLQVLSASTEVEIMPSSIKSKAALIGTADLILLSSKAHPARWDITNIIFSTLQLEKDSFLSPTVGDMRKSSEEHLDSISDVMIGFKAILSPSWKTPNACPSSWAISLAIPPKLPALTSKTEPVFLPRQKVPRLAMPPRMPPITLGRSSKMCLFIITKLRSARSIW